MAAIALSFILGVVVGIVGLIAICYAWDKKK